MLKRIRAATSKEKDEKSYGCPSNADIPHEVLLLILQKLPAKSLMRFTCVSKLWFESIVNDPRFIEAHFLESQKNPILMFNFFPKAYEKDENPVLNHTRQLFYLQKDEFLVCKEKGLPYIHKLTVLKNNYQKSLIGMCNGLACFLVGGHQSIIVRGSWSYFVIEIINFSKHEKLRIVSRIHTAPGNVQVKSCQFGYDCLSNKYKLMCILSDHANSCKYFILTLGSSDTDHLWKEIKRPEIPQWYSTQPIHNCINGVLYWWLCEGTSIVHDKRALLSFDLHEEKFQVIDQLDKIDPFLFDDDFFGFTELYFPKSRILQLEYRECLCVAIIRESDTHSGVVDLHILRDRSKQVWVKERITFDLPLAVCPSTNNNNTCTTFSLSEDGISLDIIRIIEFAGRLFLYWGKSLVHQGRQNRIIQFYDLQSRELNQVRVGSQCGSNYHVTNHIENLISLRAWATKVGDGGGEHGGSIDIRSTVKMAEGMFKQMPPSPIAAFSFFSSLSKKTMS